MYVCEDMLGMLKLMLGAIVLHHTRVTPLLGAAHRPRASRAKVRRALHARHRFRAERLRARALNEGFSSSSRTVGAVERDVTQNGV